MESLERKLDRLSPEQRKEVEDFVDFLLFRSGGIQESPASAQVPVQTRNSAPPPLILQEPVHVQDPPFKDSTITSPGSASVPVTQEGAGPFQEIVPGSDDRITRDYMDYGQFDRTSSPASIAVKKVKEKLQRLAENERPRVSLDWID